MAMGDVRDREKVRSGEIRKLVREKQWVLTRSLIGRWWERHAMASGFFRRISWYGSSKRMRIYYWGWDIYGVMIDRIESSGIFSAGCIE
jgi:hypothetical protein